MKKAKITNAIVDELARQLCEQWIAEDLSYKDAQEICDLLFAEASHYYEQAAEAYWSETYSPEAMAGRQGQYEKSLIAAGRGHLLKGG